MMDSTTEMIALADDIKAQVEKMTEFMRNEPHNSTTHLDPSKLPLSFRDSKYKALQAIQKLQALIRGPLESIMAQALPDVLPLHLVHGFELAKAVPTEGEARVTYQDVAEKSGLPERDVRSIIRAAIHTHLFDETEDGYVIHTPQSRLMAEDPHLHAGLEFALSHSLPSQLKLPEAMKTYPQSTSPSETAFALAHGHQSLYECLKSDPGVTKAFSSGMNILNRLGGSEAFHLIENLPAEVRGSGHKWIDIGGGDGSVMKELTRKDPSVQCVVQELPNVVANCSAQAKDERVTFMAYDFFTPQPVVDADVYYLRNVLHNWNDPDCVRILTRIVEAMKPSATIIVNDRVLPERGELPGVMDQKLRYMDLSMRTVLNSHERDLNDWNKLFDDPSLGLKLDQLIRPQFSECAILVLRLKDAGKNRRQ